jgi:hypothetical protein
MWQQAASRFRDAVREQILACTVTGFHKDAGCVPIRQGVAEHGEETLRLSFIQHRAGWIGVAMANTRSVEEPAGRLVAEQRR